MHGTELANVMFAPNDVIICGIFNSVLFLRCDQLDQVENIAVLVQFVAWERNDADWDLSAVSGERVLRLDVTVHGEDPLVR
jgi:hypothetical protein